MEDVIPEEPKFITVLKKAAAKVADKESIKNNNGNMANKIFDALVSSTFNEKKEIEVSDLSENQKKNLLQEKIRSLQTKYIEKIFQKITLSIDKGFKFSHVPFYRNDFKGWHLFVPGGYEESSPKKCAEIFMKNLIENEVIPIQINWDLSSFDNKKPNKGINTIKFFWDDPKILTIDNIEKKEIDRSIVEKESPFDKNTRKKSVLNLISPEKLSEENIKLSLLIKIMDYHICSPIEETCVKNFMISDNKITISLDDTDDKHIENINKFTEETIEYFDGFDFSTNIIQNAYLDK